MSANWRCLAVTLAVLVIPSVCLADPCTAIPDHGPKPAWLRPGVTFTGTVPYVGDGDSICVSSSPDPGKWIEVRIADFFAPELHGPAGEGAKHAMMRIVSGKRAVCTVGGGQHGKVFTYDRVIARCTIDGVSIGDLMRRAGVAEGGRGR